MSDGLNQTIKIGFLGGFSSEWMGGINYFNNLFIALEKTHDPKIIPYIMHPSDPQAEFLLKFAKQLNLNIRPKKNMHYFLAKILHVIFGTRFDHTLFKKYSVSEDLDLISHCDFPLKVPKISWISDFQHIRLPGMFSKKEISHRNYYYRKGAENSNLVILSSNDALNDFKKFSPEFTHKGRVLHFVAIPPDDVYIKTDKLKDAIIHKFKLPKKYFYVPNQFWKHKNHKVVFDAISLLKERVPEICVVFSGHKGDYRHKEIFEELTVFAEKKHIMKNIKILGLIDSIEVYYLMRNSVSIINPSLFEGWSSTVEEAKSLGKKIILSDINIHREQNPPSAKYFDPKNAEQLSSILEENWLCYNGDPDYELEEKASSQLKIRIKNFTDCYKNIVLEALEKKQEV